MTTEKEIVPRKGIDPDPRQTDLVNYTASATLARQLAAAARSDATIAAYRTDWSFFCTWTAVHSLTALPATATTIAAYVAFLYSIDRKPSSIDRALTSISQAHKLAKFKSPTTDPEVRETRSGMRRTAGTAQKKAEPITVEHLERMHEACDELNEPIRTRDRAILLLGFTGALRRAEIAALDVEHLRSVPEGMIVTIARSKTDQEGHGREIGIPFTARLCPVHSVADWIAAGKRAAGPLFARIDKGGTPRGRLTARSISRLVTNAARRAGYVGKFSAHSLRAGLATSASMKGIPEADIMDHTGHESIRVFRGYVRRGSLFLSNPVDRLLGIPDAPETRPEIMTRPPQDS